MKAQALSLPIVWNAYWLIYLQTSLTIFQRAIALVLPPVAVSPILFTLWMIKELCESHTAANLRADLVNTLIEWNVISTNMTTGSK